MSPLLISPPSMFSFPRPALRHGSVACFSSSSDQISPFVIVHDEPCGPGFVKIAVHPYFKRGYFDKKVPQELVEEKGIVGASHGWVATWKDGVLRLQDDLIPSASALDPKRISLPPLVTLPHCQTQVITNMAMSCSSPEEEDCIVAIKFLGTQLSLCRPAQNSAWINIDIWNSTFLTSRVMFSKRDETFSMLSSGGHFIASWDLHKYMRNPKLQRVRFRNLPKLTKTKWEFLDSCCKSEYLVESPGGCETFIVKRYRKKIFGSGIMKTRAMMVFKLNEQGTAVYTQDIGDLCIFLSNSEPFCIPPTSLQEGPNYIYFHDYDESGSMCIDEHLNESMCDSDPSWNLVPYYIHWSE